MTTFESLGISDRLVACLAEQGLTEPTPIQSRAIPLVLAGRDVMGLAQTGTGKTAAFGLPLIHMMSKTGKRPEPRSTRGLILAPTRELAQQIANTLTSYVGKGHLKISMVVGGQSIRVQTTRLERGTDILVATPGRLLDLIERRALTLSETTFLVLDEADQMLDLGFVHALRKIAKMLPPQRQTLLFSATMAKQMAEIAGAYLNNPERVEVAPPGKPIEKVRQSLHYVAQAGKTDLLIEKLKGHSKELALVFSRTKHGAEKILKSLLAAGFDAGSIHGNKSQGQRDRALQAFRSGQLKVLVATDVAARGIDIQDVRHVYNYDLPNVPENYVHRIGRTARAGADGDAVAFCAPAEMGELKAIEKTMGRAIPVAGGSPWAAGIEDAKPKHNGNRRRRQGGGGGGFGGGGGGGGAGGQQKRSGQNRKPRRAKSAA